MRRIPLVLGNFYHVFNRAVEGREIFLDNGEFARFVHNLYEFNDKNAVVNFGRKLSAGGVNDRFPKSFKAEKKRERLVDIIAWCLMPNHFHLLLRQIRDGGITYFLRKLGVGYANYFNLRYERSGALFQGRFKAVPMENDVQLKHVIRYIHLNPVDLIEYGWKEKGISDWQKVNQFLEKTYRWSSYWDYIGKKNFPSVLNLELIKDLHGDLAGHKAFVQDWLAKDLDRIQGLILE